MPYIESTNYGSYIVHGRDHGPEGTLVQSDWDYPSTAEDFGWSLTRVQKRHGRAVILSRHTRKGCQHRMTDGTVDCAECGITAHEFIGAAGSFLDKITR